MPDRAAVDAGVWLDAGETGSGGVYSGCRPCITRAVNVGSPLDGFHAAFAAEMTAQFFEMLSGCRT
jgi:hypothetical protein